MRTNTQSLLSRVAAPLLSLGLALAAALPATSQAFEISFGSGARVKGSGHAVDEVRTPGTFSRLRMDGSMNVIAKPGASPKVTVHADDNILPLIDTVLEGDTLVVRYKPNSSISTVTNTVVTLEFTQLSAVDSRGSGDLSIEAIKGDTLDLSVAGSGNVRVKGADLNKLATSLSGSGDMALQGRAMDLNISIAGSGDVRAQDLQSRNASVSIAGSGDARVNASETLKAQIAGSGDIAYSGNPKVSSKVAGSGEVHPAR